MTDVNAIRLPVENSASCLESFIDTVDHSGTLAPLEPVPGQHAVDHSNSLV